MGWNRSSTQSVLGLVPSLLALGCGANMVLGEREGVECERTKTGQAQTQEQSTDQSGWSVKRADQAVARARRLLGVTNATKFPATAELVTLATDDTPFLSEQLIGRPLWRVTIPNWSLELTCSRPELKDRYVRTLDAYLDPKNGQVLKVRTRLPDGVAPLAPEQAAASAARQMASGLEYYHAFPSEQPPISFLEAVDIVHTQGGNPFAAKEIIAVWVVWSRMEAEPRPMWVITLRGIPPIPAAYPGVRDELLNHLRFVALQRHIW